MRDNPKSFSKVRQITSTAFTLSKPYQKMLTDWTDKNILPYIHVDFHSLCQFLVLFSGVPYLPLQQLVY